MKKSRYGTIESFENLKERIDRFFRTPLKRAKQDFQLSLDLQSEHSSMPSNMRPYIGIADFINFLSDAVPNGELYLFGGILRDIALFGRKGFNSDIDIVVEGDWESCEFYLQTKGAIKNKFGGYRLQVEGWPIDIWNAKKTWAVTQGLIEYKGIASLTNSTVLNWDAILMNWRTRSFIYGNGYLESLKARRLDVVLEKNPNPIGMAVRVFRHLCMKDTRQITPKATEYLANCTTKYSFNDLITNEFRSYGNTVIDYAHYRWFESLTAVNHLGLAEKAELVKNSLEREGLSLSSKQAEWKFDKDSAGAY